MLIRLAHDIHRLIRTSCHRVQTRFIAWTRPPGAGFVRCFALDLARGRAELVAENALLRQQLIVLERQVKRPTLRRRDQLLMVLLASRLRTWRRACARPA
jgi:putative transposase